MSGLVGHSMYAVLGAKAALARKLPVTPIAMRHYASYLAGAYLGSDVQTMPEAACTADGREVGYGTVPMEKCPETGGPVEPWMLRHSSGSYRPREIHDLFYGRAHLVFGWTKAGVELRVPWDHLPDYFAAVVEDTFELFGPAERSLAYVFGWMVHVVSDSLIKSMHPGIDLHLVDGKYTPRNRPVQDLVTYHDIGIREFGLDWPALFAGLAATPVEPVQLHYMRVAPRRGRLGGTFAHGWIPERRALLEAVLAENRRWVRFHANDVLEDMRLPDGDCHERFRRLTGLRYPEMLDRAAKAGFRHALWQMGEAIADMFEATVQRSPRLARLPVRADAPPDWPAIGQRWKKRQ